MNRVKFCEMRMQAWLYMFYLTPCRPESLSDQGVLPNRSGALPGRSRHAPPCSGYDPGCSGSQKRREVGLKMERESLEDPAEKSITLKVRRRRK